MQGNFLHSFSIGKLSISEEMNVDLWDAGLICNSCIRVLIHGLLYGVKMNIVKNINGIWLKFQTKSGLFSPRQVDKGTLAMLSIVDLIPEDKILDLGCGYGVVGIYAAKCIGEENVVMCDLNELAVRTARKNASLNSVGNVQIYISNAYDNIEEKGFTKILSNPPYHTDFSVAKRFIEEGIERLAAGGRMYMVTKRGKWYKNKLVSVFGGVKIHEVGGYYVFVSEKR